MVAEVGVVAAAVESLLKFVDKLEIKEDMWEKLVDV